MEKSRPIMMANSIKRPPPDTIAEHNSAKIIKLKTSGNAVHVVPNQQTFDAAGSSGVYSSATNQQIRINLDALPSFLTTTSAVFGQSAPEPDADTYGPSDGKMIRDQDRFLPIANIARIMKRCVPGSGKIAKDSKECMQECVSEFISFLTSEAAERCHEERRKTLNGEDLLWALQTLGFEPYVEPLKLFLSKYRAACRGDKSLDVDQFDDVTYDQILDDDDDAIAAEDLDRGDDLSADFQRQRRALLDDVISSANDRRALQSSASSSTAAAVVSTGERHRPNASQTSSRVVQLTSASSLTGQLLLRAASTRASAAEEAPCGPRTSNAQEGQQNKSLPVLYLDSSGHLSTTSISSQHQQSLLTQLARQQQATSGSGAPSVPQNVQFARLNAQNVPVALQSQTTSAAKRTTKKNNH